VTEALSGDTYPTNGLVYFLALHLLRKTVGAKQQCKSIEDVRSALETELRTRWSERISAYYIPLLLDPRTKSLSFLTQPEVHAYVLYIILLMYLI